jgi:hypothetical protein
MIRRRSYLLAAGLLTFFLAMPCLQADSETNQGPDFKEVYDLLREHLKGVSDAELNRFAVQGLVSGLAGKVSLVGAESSGGDQEKPMVSRSNLLEGQIAYVRITRVANGLPEALRQTYSRLSSSNELNGLILDLRFAGGQDYAAAAATADLFMQKERPLLDWGEGLKQSKEKADALTAPVAVMVNQDTAGAAEALAAVLRQTGAGLILGGRTAGQAVMAQEYPLKGGARLRIATSPIHLGDGSDLSSEGIKPDISVTVGAQAERSYYADAFKEPGKTNALVSVSSTGTNRVASASRARRPRFNEAELVRERRDGYIPDTNGTDTVEGDSDLELVRDPVLARALDVLKGLAVVRRSRS